MTKHIEVYSWEWDYRNFRNFDWRAQTVSDQNKIVGDFMAILGELSVSQLVVSANSILGEMYKRMMTK